MGACGCVVPIDWTAFCEGILPRWLDALRGGSLEEFAAFAGANVADLGDTEYPANYLEDLGHAGLSLPLAADCLRSSEAHRRAQESWAADCGTTLVTTATFRHAAVRLSGDDAFAHAPHDGHYSTAGRAPDVQVAGFKNRPSFLEFALPFEAAESYTPDGRFEQRYRRRGTDTRHHELLELLFLGLRSIPGVWVFPEAGTWPTLNHEWIAGYLMPDEVQQLAGALGEATPPDGDDEVDDELFPLFLDRVRRAASDSAGLMAIHDGLF